MEFFDAVGPAKPWFIRTQVGEFDPAIKEYVTIMDTHPGQSQPFPYGDYEYAIVGFGRALNLAVHFAAQAHEPTATAGLHSLMFAKHASLRVLMSHSKGHATPTLRYGDGLRADGKSGLFELRAYITPHKTIDDARKARAPADLPADLAGWQLGEQSQAANSVRTQPRRE